MRNEVVNETRMVELRVAARPESIGLARLALGGVAMLARLTPDDVADLKLAVSEACTNVVKHAYPDGAESGEMVVRYRLEADALSVEVLDSGVGFDVASASVDPLRAPSESRMGLVIARAVTDLLEIDSRSSGTRVVLAKRCRP